MEEKENKKKTVNLLAVLLAFILGLTVGNIRPDAILTSRSQTTTKEKTSLINREKSSTTTESFSTTEEETGAPSVTVTESATTTTASTEKETEAAVTLKQNKITAYNEEDFFTIYRTPTGKRYHFNPGCAGENRIETNLDEATSLGLTPCMKCAGG